MLKKILILFIVAVQLLGLPASVYAAKMDEIFYSQNDIVWYDPTGGACVAASTGVSGSTAIEKVWSGLIWVGFSPEQAAGIMGNMQSESAFSPTRHETSFLTGGNKSASTKSDFDTNAGYSYGIGLIQWSFGRRVKAINKLKEANLYDPYIKSPETYSMPGQELIDSGLIEDAVLNNIYAVELQFLNQEVNDVKSYRGIFDQTTVEDATQFFLEHVEIPKNPTLSHHPERLTQAEAIYAMYKSGQLSSSASAGSAIPGSTNPENASNIEWLSDIPGLTKGEPDGATGAGGGQTFASGQPTKIVLHDTEETGWPDYTSSSSAKGAYAPHFTVNLKEKKGRQHFALNKTSGATTNGDAESIQIEIVGFVTNKSVSGVDSNYVLHNMADEDWDYLAKYLIAINKATGIPLTSSVNWNNSGPNDTHQTTDVRMTKSDWNAYKGVLGHMHVPGDDHWDPGPIWSKVQAAVERSGDSSACKSDAGNGDVNATALLLAWPERGKHSNTDPKPEYREALNAPGGVAAKRQGDTCSIRGDSCDAFVATVYRYSGADPSIPCCGAANMMNWLSKSPNYEEITGINNTANLKAGDIFSSPGHIEVYVIREDGSSAIASASHCDRTGEVTNFYNHDSSYKVFRKK